MKGKRPDEELSALPKAFRVVAVHRVELPGLDDERHVVELSLAGPDRWRGQNRRTRFA
jgi:16S rRNA (guanine527-N7)-methyltransferase